LKEGSKVLADRITVKATKVKKKGKKGGAKGGGFLCFDPSKQIRRGQIKGWRGGVGGAPQKIGKRRWKERGDSPFVTSGGPRREKLGNQ